MSPVVIMPGYTKRFLDGDITVESQLDKIRTSFKRITEANEVELALKRCGRRVL